MGPALRAKGYRMLPAEKSSAVKRDRTVQFKMYRNESIEAHIKLSRSK
jgi:hypothetical protein